MAFTPQTYAFEEVLSSTKMNQLDTNIDEVRRHHKDSSAPNAPVAGTMWIDDTAPTLWRLNVYDGTDWIQIGTINPTDNEFIATAGIWRYLTEQSLAGSPSSVDVIDLDLGNYDYLFVCQNIQGVNDNVDFQARLDTDNGASFETSGYQYCTAYITAGTSSWSVTQSSSAGAILIADNHGSGSSDETIYAEILLQQEASGLCRLMFRLTYTDTSGNFRFSVGGGALDVNVFVDAIRFMFASGNFDTPGVVIIYRREKSVP